MRDLYLDIGSTNVKACIGGAVTAIPFPQPCRRQGCCYEVDTEEIFALVACILRECQPERLFLSVQMHGYILLNKGREVTPYISWRDERGKALVPNFTLTAEYGVRIKPNLPRLSIQAQTVEFDEFCTLGSYLVRRLMGKNATHITDAAPSGFYNVKENRADDCPFALPEAYAQVVQIGSHANTAIFSPVGDQQCAVLGATEGKDDDCYILNLGTAAQLCCVEKQFVTGDFESRPYFGGGTLCTVTGLSGGGAIAECEDARLAEKLATEYGKALQKLPPRSGLTVTGGLMNYRRALFEDVLKRMGFKTYRCAQGDALQGLKMIARGIK